MFVFKNITIQHFTCPKSHSPNVRFCLRFVSAKKSPIVILKSRTLEHSKFFKYITSYKTEQLRTLHMSPAKHTEQHVLSSFDIFSYSVILREC